MTGHPDQSADHPRAPSHGNVEGARASDTWADQLRFWPWIQDGHGTLYNQAFYDARRRLANRDGSAAPVLLSPFHDALTSLGEEHSNA